MKTIRTILIVVATTFTLTSYALANDKKASRAGASINKASLPTVSATYAAVGTVKQTDIPTGKVTIAHEAIKSLYWPAMTMGFLVKDPALFNKLTVGKQVEFQLAKEGNEYVVVDVK